MNKLKIAAISVGGVVAFAHIGLLGYVFHRPKQPQIPQVPTINIPSGTPYSSYKVEANKDGYKIEYEVNDPAILESHRSLNLDKDKKGMFVAVTRNALSSVVINTPWTVPVTWEVGLQSRESLQKK